MDRAPTLRARIEAGIQALRAALDLPGMPWLAGLVAVVVTLVTWGGLNPVGVYHDETAYLLQATLLAHGHFVGGVPPIPEFFEQFHVLFTPGVTAKYPPGFALAMVPGIWLGAPALVPLLLTGLTAGLGYALARRVAGAPVAFLAVMIWLVSPGNLRFRAGYFSELLTSLLWIAGWWALLRWRDSGRPAWLYALAAAVGAAAITRPLSALVLAIPVGFVVLREVWRRRAWPALGGALAIGTGIVLLLPLQNRLTTGSWRTSPYEAYTTAYLPFDRLGFGLDSTPPTRELPGDMQALTRFFTPLHVGHTAAQLPATAATRVRAMLRDVGGFTALVAAILVVAGLLAATAEVCLAATTVGLLILAHLPYAHFPVWTIYYLEAYPVVALLMALGVARAGRAGLLGSGTEVAARRDLVVMAAGITLVLLLPVRAFAARQTHQRLSAGQDYFRALVEELPGPSIVFVRYGPRHVMHYSLIENPADYALAKAWTVYDRGDDNARLRLLAPNRTAYLYDEDRLELVELGR
jgi:hypothetical protein